MEKVIDNLPEVVVLKGDSQPGERIATEVGEGIMRILRDFVQQRPVEFYQLARLCQRRYFRAAQKALRAYFPGSEAAVPAMLAVFRAALISDGIATRLSSPYDLALSYWDTGLLYDQHLYRVAQQIGEIVFQVAADFGNPTEKPWLIDRRKKPPRLDLDRAQGLFLRIWGNDIPHSLITPWGVWQMADYTDRTMQKNFWKGETRLIDVVTADLTLEPIYEYNHFSVYAVTSAFGEKLPPAKFLPEPEKVTVGYSHYITAVWEHAANWLDPEQYFCLGRQ